MVYALGGPTVPVTYSRFGGSGDSPDLGLLVRYFLSAASYASKIVS